MLKVCHFERWKYQLFSIGMQGQGVLLNLRLFKYDRTLVKKFTAKSGGNGHFCHETPKWITFILKWFWALNVGSWAVQGRAAGPHSALKTFHFKIRAIHFGAECGPAALPCTAQLPTYSAETCVLYAIALKSATLRRVLLFFRAESINFFTKGNPFDWWIIVIRPGRSDKVRRLT